MDGLHQCALVVGLEVLEGVPEFLRSRTGRGDVVVESAGPVDVRLALAQQIEIRSGQQHDQPAARHCPRPPSRCCISARVATTSAPSMPRTTSTPSGPSSTKVRSWLAFLSRDMNDKSCSGSTSAGNSGERSNAPTTCWLSLIH